MSDQEKETTLVPTLTASTEEDQDMLHSHHTRDPLVPAWTRFTQKIHNGFTVAVTFLALTAARRPKQTIGVMTFLSFALLGAGFASGNFELVLDIKLMFTPSSSLPKQHNDWIEKGSGFNATRPITLFFHNDGNSVLHPAQTRRVLEAVEIIRTTPGFEELCQKGSYLDFDNKPTCHLWSVSGFWDDHSLEVFDATVKSERDIQLAVAKTRLANGAPIFPDAVLGNWERESLETLPVQRRTSNKNIVITVIDEKDPTTADATTDSPTVEDPSSSQAPSDTSTDGQYIMTFAPTEDATADSTALEDPSSASGSSLAPSNTSTDVQYIMTSAPTEDATDSPVVQDPTSSGSGSSQAPPTIPPQYIMTSAQSYFIHVDIPDLGDEADAVEDALVKQLNDKRSQWIDEDSNKPEGDSTRLYFTFRSAYAYQMEGMELVFNDMYLVAVAAMIVVVFTCIVFYRHDAEKSESRTLLGIASILTITMSLLAGCGIMFLAGVPWTTCTQMLPYVVYGVGLDDTFIITGAYFQLQRHAGDFEERIRLTMQQIGWSICLTTITTVVAFLLGAISSSFPGIQWLCFYAFSIIMIVFFFQVTYFIAWLALDERRLEANRRDVCCCCLERHDGDPSQPECAAAEHQTPSASSTSSSERDLHLSVQERFMIWYSSFLMRPVVKATVLVLFTTLFALCAYSASNLEQSFDINDYVADESYLKSFFSDVDQFSSVVRPMEVFFRDVDQASPEVQQQMINYVEDLEGLEQIGSSGASIVDATDGAELRPFCWVRDFEEFLKYNDDPFIATALEQMTFVEKLDFALSDKTVREVYGQDIVRDPETGNITASKCTVILRKLDLTSIPDQVDFLHDQREVTRSQPINEGRKRWAFFSFNTIFFLMEASSIVMGEMFFTSIAGIVAVSAAAFVFIPHWTGACYIVPLMFVLYIDLLGMMHFFGLTINPVSYVCIVVSIGLLVDFLIHILLRYFEATPGKTRDGRVKETLVTMGVSILVGGITTFLAVIPLSFSSAAIFMTVFYSFFSTVVLGITHGLILLPVLLSYFGPTVSVAGHLIAIDTEISEISDKKDPPLTPRTEHNEDEPMVGSPVGSFPSTPQSNKNNQPSTPETECDEDDMPLTPETECNEYSVVLSNGSRDNIELGMDDSPDGSHQSRPETECNDYSVVVTDGSRDNIELGIGGQNGEDKN